MESPKKAWVDKHVKRQWTEGVDYDPRDARETMDLAKQLWPGGEEAEKINFSLLDAAHVDKLKDRLKLGKPIYGSTIVVANCTAHADILIPQPDGTVHMVEVAAVCNPREEHVERIAFQSWVFEQAGLKISNQKFAFLDSSYVKEPGIPIDATKIMKVSDITEEVGKKLPHVDLNVQRIVACLADTINPPDEPTVYCPEIDDAKLPVDHYHTLTRATPKKKQAMVDLGLTDLKQFPTGVCGVELSPTQKVQVEAIRTGVPQVNRAKLQYFFSKLKYPIHYMDFESFQTAVPMYDKSKPYQQIPFQWSMHVVDYEGAEPRHSEFLHDSKDDPRPAFLASLKEAIGPKGSIVCFNSTFEKGRLEEGAEMFPEHKDWIEKAILRTEDLYAPFRSFDYYHPDQHGSTSIKYVLPALTGDRGYSQMVVGDGLTAAKEYARMIFDDKVSPEEKASIRANLLHYCKKDTRSLIPVQQVLQNAMSIHTPPAPVQAVPLALGVNVLPQMTGEVFEF